MKNSLKSFLIVLSLLLPVAVQAGGLHGKTLTSDGGQAIAPQSIVAPIVTPCDAIDGASSLDALISVAISLGALQGNNNPVALDAAVAALFLRQSGFNDASAYAFLLTELRILFDCQ